MFKWVNVFFCSTYATIESDAVSVKHPYTQRKVKSDWSWLNRSPEHESKILFN